MSDETSLTDLLLNAHNLMRCYRTIWYGKNFDGLDPNQGKGRILSTLRQTSGISQKELGTILNVRPQPLGEHLRKLEANGYIERYQSPEDKRALIVRLTAEGEFIQMNTPDYDELFIDLNAKEKAELKKCLEKISARLKELIDKETEDKVEDFS